MRKMLDRAGPRFFLAVMIVLVLALHFWSFRSVLPVASAFFALGVIYGVLLFRVVSLSGRAFMAMYAAWILMYLSMILLQQALGIPAAGPWFLGAMVGCIAGDHIWLGPQAGGKFKPKHLRRRNPDGGYPGGWQPAALNAVCALLLLGLGLAHFLLQSPTLPVGILLAAACLAGWTLFRFAKTPQTRTVGLLAAPLLLFALLLLGYATDQAALGMVVAYGVPAGALIGGRYWAGPRFGEPRPPFAGQGTRRRRKRRPKKKREEAGHGHLLATSGVPTP